MLIKSLVILIIVVMISIGAIMQYMNSNTKKINNNETSHKPEITLKQIYTMFQYISLNLHNNKFDNKYLSPILFAYLKKNIQSFEQIVEIQHHNITRNEKYAVVEFFVKLINGRYGSIKLTYDNFVEIIYDINDMIGVK